MDLHRRIRVVVALGVVCASAWSLAGCGGGDTSTSTTKRTTTTVTTAPSSTTAPPGSTAAPPTTDPARATAEAVWPWAASGTRYTDPVQAARGFATDLVGFTDPVMGEYRPGDANSGEVDVRAKAVSAPTTVLVRRIGGTWWVLGATTTDIQPSAPAAGATVASPLALAGTSTAFEATVNVRLVADGAAPATPSPTGPRATLATGIVMGGSMGTLGPFSGSLTFTSPGAGTSGTLVFLTLSPEDGRVLIAAVLRVHFS